MRLETEMKTKSRHQMNHCSVRTFFFDYEGTRVIESPDKQYNGGPLSLQSEGTISFSFADCHNVGCVRPEGINSVYLVNEDVNDEDIINDAIDDNLKYEFEQTDSESFQFKVSDGITGSNPK